MHLSPSTQTPRKERSMFRGCKTLPPLQFALEKWRVPICDRTPSWGQEDKIWTLLLLRLIQLLHRHYLVLSSWDPGDGIRLKRVHRRRQGRTLADFKCEKPKHSSVVSENQIRKANENKLWSFSIIWTDMQITNQFSPDSSDLEPYKNKSKKRKKSWENLNTGCC